MTPEELAEIHSASFTGAQRPWSAKEIAELLSSDAVDLFEKSRGFALSRIAGPEAELLTISVHPDSQRQGIADFLLSNLHNSLRNSGAEEIFLEVSEKNLAARSLYEKHGYSVCGVRKHYYIGPNGQKFDAIVMRRAL